MGQEMANLKMPVEESPDSEAPAVSRKPVELSYTIEELLSFADLEWCKIRPENLDKAVWRDAPAPAEGAEGGLSLSSRGLVRRDREGEVSGKSPADIPEWRKDSWRSGGSATSLAQGSRRKPYDEDPSSGNAFSTSYPPRPSGSWGGDNGHMRSSYDNRYWLQGQGSGRLDHRSGLQDRDRDQGRPFQTWDGEDSVPPILPPDALPAAEGMRPFGVPMGRPGWSPTERDGLLGSGGNLHRTYTGNFTTMRSGLDRQMSLGVPERQMSIGPQERLIKIGPADRHVSMGVPPDRQVSMGVPPDRQVSMGVPPDRQMSLAGIPPPERQMSIGPLERQMSLGPGPERQMSLGARPPERQLSMGVMDRVGRAAIPRHPELYHQSRSSKGLAFARRDDTDSNNDETFGSENNSTYDRAEEERRRRESFESLRKDQQRLLHQNQQKQEQRLSDAESNASRKHDETTLWDNSTLSVDKSFSPSSKLPEKVVFRSEDGISSGVVSSAAAVPVMPRPAIPPGFDKRPLQQNPILVKPSSAAETKVEGDNYVQETDNNLKQTSIAQNETTSVLQHNVRGDGSAKERITSEVADSLAVFTQPPPLEAQQAGLSQIRVGSSSAPGEAAEEWRLNTEGTIAIEQKERTTNKEKDDMFVGVDDHRTTDHQGSILDKWFGGAAGKGSGEAAGPASLPLLVDENKTMKEALWLGGDAKISKFAQWFPPEVNNQADAVSRDILSLFPQSITAPKAASSLSTPEAHAGVAIRAQNFETSTKSTVRTLPMPSGPSLEDIERGLKATTLNAVEEKSNVITEAAAGFTRDQRLKSGPVVDTEHDAIMIDDFGGHSPVGKGLPSQLGPTQQAQQFTEMKKSSPVFLTCEDIEQSMLAEAGTATSFEMKVPNLSLPTVETTGKVRKTVADSAASWHLLSLLQKSGPPPLSPENTVTSSRLESYDGGPLRAATKQDDWEQGSSSPCKESPEEEENPKLEALFGKQFMSELRAVEAPLSATVFAEDDVVYPVNRQFSTRMKTNHSSNNSNITKQWPGPIGPLSGLCMLESNMLVEAHKHGEGAIVPGRLWTTDSQFAAASEREDSQTTPLSSSLGLWGNGASAHLSDESGLASNLSFANKDTSVSGADSTSFVSGDAVGRDSMLSSKGPLSGLQSDPYVNIGNSFETSGDSTMRAPLRGFSLSQFKVANDGNLAASQKFLPGTESLLAISTNRSSDSSQVSPVFNEDVLVKGFQGNDAGGKFGAKDLSTVAQDESSSPANAMSQGSDSLLVASSQVVNSKEILVDGVLNGDPKEDFGADGKLADTLAEIAAVGRAMDGGHNSRAPIAAAAVLPEHVKQGGLIRVNSAFSTIPMRFKGNSGGLQLTTSGFPPYQPVGPLQHQHSLGAEGYRSEASTLIQPRLQPGVPVHPLHHPLPQQNHGPSSIPIFPTQQFHSQPGLPQPQLLGRTFSNGSALDFPHVAYGHPPSANLNRPSLASGGPPQFSPSAAAVAQGHLPQPGIYHPMGPGAPPAPAHFLSSAQVPPRAAVVHAMADPRMFIQEQQGLHDPHGLGTKPPGPQAGPNLFPLRGHSLQAGQGAAMFHQPMPSNLRGPPPQNYLVPGPAAPWSVPPYSSELMRTSKPQELTGFANGGVMGGPGSLDRWFGMEQLGRSGSGIPSPAGLIPLSAHGLNAESKMRFG